MKKIIATIMTLALVLGLCSATAFAADDIVLNGDASGSSFIGEFTANAAGGYQYMGWATTNGATADYKYLQFTYTGDIKYLRFEFENTDTKAKSQVYWMTADQFCHFVTADGSEIPTTGNNTTVVIDLAATGISLGDYTGFHMHYLDPSVTSGSFTISDARVMTSATSSPATDTPAADTPAETQASTQAPATGSTAVPTVIACLVVLCAGAVLVFNKKRA